MKQFLMIAALCLWAAPILSSYTLSKAKWVVPTVSYYVNAVSKDVSPDAALAAVQSAATGWKAQSGARLTLNYAGPTTGASLTRNRKNEVFFRGSHESFAARTYSWWDSYGRRLESDIVFYEDSVRWFVGSGCVSGSGVNRGVYVESHAAHEFGHFQGLGHSTVSGATMQASSGQCSRTWISLHADDITGILRLYP